jgi:cell division cycle protein 20 (cofactor of APC complex)
MDDYYLNLLSWGLNDVVAIALGQAVYLWHADDGRIDQLVSFEGSEDYVTSVQWSNIKDNTIAIGTSNNAVQVCKSYLYLY